MDGRACGHVVVRRSIETNRRQLSMMGQANFNIVRVAEFSRDLFEPEEGKYEFDWLDSGGRLDSSQA